MDEEVNKKGRPSIYSEEIVDEICEQIATTSQGLNEICKRDGIPSFRTVFNWLNDGKHNDFLQKYTRAREQQADLLADQIITIADDHANDTIINPNSGEPQMNAEWVARCRVQIDARKWKASKLAPKKYSDRVVQDVNLNTEPPLFPENKD